ncbi:MAG: hypothetical protein K2W33_06915, partial [Burkholderiales bacterium]|nr:hypothetical protein [Burkholderiales bacterium]
MMAGLLAAAQPGHWAITLRGPEVAALRWRHVWRRWALCLAALCMWGQAWAVRDDVRLGLTLEPPGLDPTTVAAAAVSEMVYANVLEGLTVLDAQGRIAPRLATTWTLSADRKQLDLTLRSGVRFHDARP